MKKILSAIAMLFTCYGGFTQVAISNPSSNPDPSAMLDIKSTTKGMLLPRMTSAQRTAIASPATGLMVYETSSNAIMVYNGTSWVPLGSGGGGGEWIVNGTNIYNSNTGNVGIGVNAPTYKLEVAGSLLLNSIAPSLRFKRGTSIFSFSTIDFTEADDAVVFRQSHGGTSFTLGRPNGFGTFQDLVVKTDNGYVGIGHNAPADKLDVDGSVRLTGESRQLRFETGQAGGLVTKYAPGLRFIRSDNTALGTIEYVDTVGTNFFRFRTGSAISNDFVITTGHDICIGGSNPNAKFEVRGSGEVMRIHAGLDPLLQFSTGNAGGGLGLPLVRKGFLDVNGNDFRIGTNAENNNGNFIVRVNGINSMYVNPSGQVGIGNIPETKLHIASGSDAGLTGNGYIMLGSPTGSNIVFDNNEILARTNGAAGALVLQHDGGTVRIGNVAVPAGYKFAINGKAICEELKVKLASSGWPDYVFADNYKLLSLSQLEKYIQQNRHLPNIPSAAEVEKNGLEVGDMQKRMMEKIEELTLYIIELQKQIDQLKEGNKQTASHQ